MQILLILLSAATWVECVVQRLRTPWLLYLTIQKAFIMTSGSAACCITLAWVNPETQDLYWSQNATLAESGFNGVDVHLFEVMDAGEYVYCGRIELVDKPYADTQPGEDGVPRKVWMFPVRPVPDNDVQKPQMFVFKDMKDYKARGKKVDEEYTTMMQELKKSKTKPPIAKAPVYVKPELKPSVVIPADIVGKTVKHKTFGTGKITEIAGTTIVIQFETVGEKKIGYEFCMEKKLLEFV